MVRRVVRRLRRAALRGAHPERGRRWCSRRRPARAGARPAAGALALRGRGCRRRRSSLDVAARVWPEVRAALPAWGRGPLAFSRARACARSARRCIHGADGGARACAREHRFRDDCARISAPTLVVTGEDALDRVVPVRRRGATPTLHPRAAARVLRAHRTHRHADAALDRFAGSWVTSPMPPSLISTGPAGPLEALLDEPPAAPRARGRRLRASASAARRDDAHQGGVPGRQGAGADRLRGAALQLPRRRPQRGDVRPAAGELRGLPRGARLHGGALSRRAAVGGRLLVRRVGRARSRRRRRPRLGADRHRAAGRDSVSGMDYTFPNTLASTKPKFFVQGEADEVCPLEGCGRSTAARGAEGARRHRRGRSPVRRKDAGGRRGARGPAGRLSEVAHP